MNFTRRWIALVALVVVAVLFVARGRRDGAGLPSETRRAPASRTLPVGSDDPAGKSAMDETGSAARQPVEPASVPTAPAAASGERVLVRGRVVNRDGEPLAGATALTAAPCGAPHAEWNWIALDAKRPERCSTVTRATCGTDGTFELELARAAEFHVAVRLAGFAGIDLERELRADQGELDLGPLALEVGATLSGRVVDESGRPVAGAEIARFGLTEFTERYRIDWSDVVLATSAADGTFELDTLTLGPTELEVRVPGFVRQHREVFADGERAPEWRVELERAAPITGRVFGAPAGAELSVQFWLQSDGEQHNVCCAPDGSFAIDGLAPGLAAFDLYAMRKRDEGSGGGLESFASPDWECISSGVSVRPGMRDVEVRVPAPVVYRVQVVDGPTREPLSDVHLGLLEGFDFESARRLDVRAEAGGVYATSLLMPSSPSGLCVSHLGHERVALGQIPFLPGEIHDFGVVALDRLAPTRVRVVSAYDGAPIEGVELVARIEFDDDGCGNAHMVGDLAARMALPDGWKGTTASDGTATAYLSCTMPYWISTTSADHAPLWRFVPAAHSPPAEIELRLLRGGAVTVSYRDARTSAALSDKGIQCEYEGQRVQGGRTDLDGRVRFEHLAPGSYRFSAARDEEEASVQVVDGAAVEVTLELGHSSVVRLHGTITERGRPLAGARVETMGGETATDRDGRYDLPDEEAGDDKLVVTHPRTGPIWVQDIGLAAPETVVDIDLTPARLEGVVRDEAGAPLAGVAVSIGSPLEDGRFAALEASEGPLHWAESAADGSFAFPAVQPRGELYLLVEKGGFHTERLGPLVLPTDGPALVLTPRLRRALELDVIVQGLDRQTHLVTRVSARWRGEEELAPDDRELEAERGQGDDLQEYFHLSRLRPGPWSIELRDFFSLGDDRPLARADVTLAPSGNSPVVLRP